MPHVSHLLTGVGPTHAGRALAEYLASHRPSLVVSTGFAGGLREDLEPGTWVTARTLAGSDAELRLAPPPAVPCAMVSSSTLVQGATKLEGDAVDMESVALAGIVASHKIPFMVLRLVSDSPGRPLPKFLGDFTAAFASSSRREKLGHAARGLRQALGDPRGVVRIVREGREWTQELASGWSAFGRSLEA